MFSNLTWGFKPILLSNLVILVLIYFYYHGKNKSLHPTESSFWQPLYFLAGLSLLYGLAISPLDALGRNHLFYMHMLESMVFVYVLPCCMLQSLPKPLLSKWYAKHPEHKKTLQYLSGIIVPSVIFNLLFLCLHIPAIMELSLHHTLLAEFMPLLLLALGCLMWFPILNPIKPLEQMFSEQMFYLMTLILGQVPLFAILTFSDQGLFPTYLKASRVSMLTAYGDQQLAGWLFKLCSLLIFSAAFVTIFLRWNAQQRIQDKDDNTLAYENFELIQRAPKRKG